MSDRNNALALLAMAEVMASTDHAPRDIPRGRSPIKRPTNVTNRDRKKREKKLAQRRYEKLQQRKVRR